MGRFLGAAGAGKGLCTGRVGIRFFCTRCLSGTKATSDCSIHKGEACGEQASKGGSEGKVSTARK